VARDARNDCREGDGEASLSTFPAAQKAGRLGRYCELEREEEEEEADGEGGRAEDEEDVEEEKTENGVKEDRIDRRLSRMSWCVCDFTKGVREANEWPLDARETSANTERK
jgi:hypothetical protein